METEEIELFAHAEGGRPRVVAAGRGETLREVLARLERVHGDDVVVFVGECEEALAEGDEIEDGADRHEPVDIDLTLEVLEIERHCHIHCHRCRHIAVEVLCANIEYTRFPVPIENEREAATDYPALLRASDLIGQLADPNYMRKIAALFAEFAETGMNEMLGYDSSAGLRAAYPKFFWSTVTPYIEDALNDLRMTQDGQLWVANLYSHVFAEEHKLPALGAERIRD